ERREFDLPLNPVGSERARRLWQLLAEIPYGQTTTYGALARSIGDGISPRAIGGFVGHNPLSIFIPCHRVVGSTGKLTGYAGGLDRKQYLLELENAIPVAPQALWEQWLSLRSRMWWPGTAPPCCASCGRCSATPTPTT